MIARPSGKMVISKGAITKRRANSLARTSPERPAAFSIPEDRGAAPSRESAPRSGRKGSRGRASRVEVDEIAPRARRAIRIARRLIDLADDARPHIDRMIRGVTHSPRPHKIFKASATCSEAIAG